MNRATARRLLHAHLEGPVARLLAGLGLSPNTVTLLGLLVAANSAYLLSTGHLWVGGLVLLASGVFDLFDGALARETGRVTAFGALLDSVVDRLSEAVVLLGLLIFYLDRSSNTGALLVFLALAGSVMVSYLRARAEALAIECRVGVMTRPERVATLGVGLIVGHWWADGVLVALGAIAGLTLLTASQRLFHIWRTIGRRG